MASSRNTDPIFWPKCECNRRCDLEDDTSDDEYYDDDDSSYIDVDESEDESVKFFFISVYNNSFIKNTIIISDAEEIQLYRSKYSKLTDKSAKATNIWGDVKVQIPMAGTVAVITLKKFLENLLKNSNQRKILQLKRPRPSEQNSTNNSVKTDNINAEKSCSTKLLEKGKENLKINNKLIEKNIDKKVQDVKINSVSQSKDKQTKIKVENKSDINSKVVKTVNNTNKNTEIKTNIATKSKELDKETKNQTSVNNTKSSVSGTLKSNSTFANNLRNGFIRDQKSNSANIPLKDNLENKEGNKNENKPNTTNEAKNHTPAKNTKSGVNEVQNWKKSLAERIRDSELIQQSNTENNTASKINLKNQSESKDKEKFTSSNQSSTPKKSNIINKNENINTNGIVKATNTPEKVAKINFSKQSNKSEINNSANEPKSSNVADKLVNVKKDLASTPSKKDNTVNKNKQTNSNENNKDMNNSTKQTVPEFKKPLDVKPTLNGVGKNNTVKNYKKSPTDQAATASTENHIQEEIIDKTTRKKLKKQRQKEKKMDRNRRDSSNCSSRDTTDISSSRNSSPDIIKSTNKKNKISSQECKTNKKQEGKNIKNQVEDDTEASEQSEYIKTSDDEVDFLTDDENLPVFLAKIKEKSKSKEKNNKVKTSAKTNSNSTKVKDSTNDNNEEFIIYTKKRNKISNPVIDKIKNPVMDQFRKPSIDKNSILYSENFGENACFMILENNFMGALEYLVDAINFNYTDQRHYLNRCYCYLSMKKNALALADAEYVLQITNHIGYQFIANLRAAQASYGLQNYDQAEMFIKEASRLNPTSVYVPREMIIIQVARIVSNGFSEKDALLALEKYNSVDAALNDLFENNINKLNNSIKDEITLDNYDEFEYSSDEEEPSNAEIVNRMLNYEPGTIKFQHIISKPPNAHILACNNSKKTEKKVILNGKTNSEQDKAIWVGNLTSIITDTMLRKKFKEFGKVVSVYHPLNELYAFVNFERAEDVANVLSMPHHEIAGIKLFVKAAIRQK